jgi:hypothetical protein
MLEEISEVSMTQEDGDSPIMLGAGSAPGESGVFVVRASCKGGMHVSATARRHHVFFTLSDQSRFECRIAGRSLSHIPRCGTLAICHSGSDYFSVWTGRAARRGRQANRVHPRNDFHDAGERGVRLGRHQRKADHGTR